MGAHGCPAQRFLVRYMEQLDLSPKRSRALAAPYNMVRKGDTAAMANPGP